jgi:hypothetical protein
MNTQDEGGDQLNEEEGFLTPSTRKRSRKQDDNTALLASAVSILQATAGRLNASAEDCEVKSFCSFLTSKMMAYRPTTRQMVQHAIYDILVKADRGLLVPSTSYGQERFQSLAQSSAQMVYPVPPHSQPIAPSTSYAPASQLHQHIPIQQSSQVDHLMSKPLSPLLSTPHPPPSELRRLDSHGSPENHSDYTPSPACSSQYSDDINEYV